MIYSVVSEAMNMYRTILYFHLACTEITGRIVFYKHPDLRAIFLHNDWSYQLGFCTIGKRRMSAIYFCYYSTWPFVPHMCGVFMCSLCVKHVYSYTYYTYRSIYIIHTLSRLYTCITCVKHLYYSCSMHVITGIWNYELHV